MRRRCASYLDVGFVGLVLLRMHYCVMYREVGMGSVSMDFVLQTEILIDP